MSKSHQNHIDISSGYVKKSFFWIVFLLISVVALFANFVYNPHPLEAAVPFASGTGTPSDPYVIADCAQLQSINDDTEYLYAHYVLSGNINCSSVNPFDSIGNSQTFNGNFLPFMGSFNGQGYTISNITVGNTGSSSVGIFATLYGASIRNLNLDTITVNGIEYLGALAGYADHSAIIGVSVTNSTITAHTNDGRYVGGIVGRALTSYLYGINSSSSTVTTTGTDHGFTQRSFGGLVGNLHGFSTLDRSRSDATVVADVSGVGGLVGVIQYGSTIINSYAAGNVTGYSSVGGVMGGYQIGGIASFISSVYSRASTTATNPSGLAGGIAGGTNGLVSITDSFAVGYVSSTTFSGGISGDGVSTMRNNVYYPAGTGQTRCTGNGAILPVGQCTSNNSSSYYNLSSNAPLTAWNFTDIWIQVPSTRPELRLFPYTEPLVATSISTCSDLAANVRANPVGWFELLNNINCAGNSALLPVTGNTATSSAFHGIFDGQGYTVSGITMSRGATSQYQYGLGFFSRLYGATVRDVTLNGGGVSATTDLVDRVGALAGTGMGVVVENVTSSVPVTTGGQFGGGLIGFASGKLSNIVVTGDVDSVDSVPYWLGGIVGNGYMIEIDTSTYSGNIIGSGVVGGLVGYADVAFITNSTTTGTIIGSSDVGGILGAVGEEYGAQIGSVIRNSHSQMNQSPNFFWGSELYSAGGLIGDGERTLIASSSYRGAIDLGTSSDQFIGGLAGILTDSEISANSYSDVVILAQGDNGNGPYLESIGGMIGYTSNVVISNSIASTTMLFGDEPSTNYISTFYGIGGLIGSSYNTLTINNVETSGSLSIYEDTSGSSGYGYGLGGFGGYFGGSALIQNATSSVDTFIKSFEPAGLSNFVGEMANATTSNIFVSGSLTINSTEDPYDIGGFVGYGNNLAVSTTTVTGDITMTNSVSPYRIGGFSGYLINSDVTTVYTDNTMNLAMGDDGLSTGFSIGGFAGSLGLNNRLINTYASTSLSITSLALNATAATNIGGYAGLIFSTNNSITNSYSAGSLTLIGNSTAPFRRVGGFIGSSVNNANSITNSFTASTIATMASSTSVGGFIGYYTGGETFSSNTYDETATLRSLCTGLNAIDPAWCSIHNVALSEPTYFFSASNLPQSTWNFTSIWLEHPDTHPTFGVGAGGGGGSIPPTVTTSASVSAITRTTATVTGDVTSLGSAIITERGFVYGETNIFGATTTESSVGFSTGSFSTVLSGLLCNTTYYYDAYASGSDGLSYGTAETFTTSACAAVISSSSSQSSSSGTRTEKITESSSTVFDSSDQVTICHSTDNNKNVTKINVESFITSTELETEDSLRNHEGHSLDIIPYFQYDFGTGIKIYPGKNWTIENQKLHKNNCQLFLNEKPSTVTSVEKLVIPTVQASLPEVCDIYSNASKVTSVIDSNTIMTITIPEGSVRSNAIEEQGVLDYLLYLNVAPVYGAGVDSETNKFKELLKKISESKNSNGTLSTNLVKKVGSIAYVAPNTQVSASGTQKPTEILRVQRINSCGAVSTIDIVNPLYSSALIQAKESKREETIQTDSVGEGQQVLVGENIFYIDTTRWSDQDPSLLIAPFEVSVTDQFSNELKNIEKPLTLEIVNPRVPSVAGIIYITKVSEDGTTWFEVPFSIEGNSIKISVTDPGRYFIWLLPKAEASMVNVVEQVDEAVTFAVPLWLTKLLAAIGLATGVSFLLLQLARLPFSVTNLSRTLSLAVNNLFGLLTFRKRRQPWGTVYDSSTKVPVDPAFVELFDLDGKKQAEAITDLDGRYGFLVPEGIYSMMVRKTNYTFPSKLKNLSGQDVIYSDLYFGGPFNVSATVTHDVPMDQVEFDWNQYEKIRTKQTTFFHKSDPFIIGLLDFMFILGAAMMAWQFLVKPSLITGLLLALYTILLMYRLFAGKPALYGALSIEGEPLAFAIIVITKNDREILSRVTDAYGRYIAIVPPGTYTFEVKKKVGETTYESIYKVQVKSKRGVINNRIRLTSS